jgi:hypothetical protein
VATAAVVAAVVLAGLPGTGDAGPAGPPAPSTSPAGAAISFPPDDNGFPLVASVVDTHGRRELELRFVPGDTHLYVSAFCRFLGHEPGQGPSPLRATTTVNGQALDVRDCDSTSGAASSVVAFDEDEAGNRAQWEARGVRAGQPSVLRIRVTGEAPTWDLGLAVYQMGGPREVQDGVEVQRRIRVGATDYRLLGYQTAPVTAARRELTIEPYGTARDAYVLGGVLRGDADAPPTGLASVFVDERQVATAPAGSVSGTGTGSLVPRTVGVTVSPDARGTMLVAYYEPVTPAP